MIRSPITHEEQRSRLLALMHAHKIGARYLSRALNRPERWLEGWMRYGSDPLPASERGWLARFFGVDESHLGGPHRPPPRRRRRRDF